MPQPILRRVRRCEHRRTPSRADALRSRSDDDPGTLGPVALRSRARRSVAQDLLLTLERCEARHANLHDRGGDG
jgi:hypothetical protein